MFGFGEEDSAQRRRQMMAVLQEQINQQQQQIYAQQAAGMFTGYTPTAPAPVVSDPVAAPTPTSTRADPEAYLASRFSSANLGTDADRVAALYRASVAADPDTNLAGAYEGAYQTGQNDFRNTLTGRLNTEFMPGYERTAFSDTADDPIIDALLGRQKQTAVDAIERSKQRGQLNTAGYNAANLGLTDTEATAKSKANELGGAVLSRYRTDLADSIANLRTQANSATLGSGYSLDPGIQEVKNKVTGYQGSLSGDVGAALSDQNFFDTGKILGTAGAAQGAINPGRIAVASTPEEEAKKKQLGNVGVF